MAYSMNDLKKGLRIEIDGVPYRIVEYQHVKPGKGAAFVKTKIKSLLDGRVLEKTFHAGDKCEKPDLEQKTMQYLYDDGEYLHFMDTQTYEQETLTREQVADAAKWLKDGMNVEVLYHNGKAITVEPPMTVELEVVETQPAFKGDTATGGRKPAKLETGVTINVPFHILEGDVVKVDTRTGEYIEKVK
ncbi:elongation factor P [Nitrosophilus alvini]|uniref:elongation factor P n=1 Tax=Nitrosophilus alvini TaxID=2714855 RepID=UPI00190DCD30|nr:elongation factor P [Nitrosophilus alvini]